MNKQYFPVTERFSIECCKTKTKVITLVFNNNSNNIFNSYIKYTNITPPANSKANQGRWCVDGLRFITIVDVKKYHIYNKKGHSRKKRKRKEKEKIKIKIITVANNPMNQSEHEAHTCSRRQLQKNACRQVRIGFVGFTSDWVIKWREIL